MVAKKKTAAKKTKALTKTQKKEKPDKASGRSRDAKVTIEACKSWNAFKTRAAKIEKACSEAGIKVSINAEKPRKGSFVISHEGKVLLELLDMPRPFTKLKALDMDDVIADVLNAVPA